MILAFQESKKGPPKRRSQRQIDREMKEEADRIRLENQAMMKKEREEAAAAAAAAVAGVEQLEAELNASVIEPEEAEEQEQAKTPGGR